MDYTEYTPHVLGSLGISYSVDDVRPQTLAQAALAEAEPSGVLKAGTP